jgi:hypothetical protein
MRKMTIQERLAFQRLNPPPPPPRLTSANVEMPKLLRPNKPEKPNVPHLRSIQGMRTAQVGLDGKPILAGSRIEAETDHTVHTLEHTQNRTKKNINKPLKLIAIGHGQQVVEPTDDFIHPIGSVVPDAHSPFANLHSKGVVFKSQTKVIRQQKPVDPPSGEDVPSGPTIDFTPQLHNRSKKKFDAFRKTKDKDPNPPNIDKCDLQFNPPPVTIKGSYQVDKDKLRYEQFMYKFEANPDGSIRLDPATGFPKIASSKPIPFTVATAKNVNNLADNLAKRKMLAHYTAVGKKRPDGRPYSIGNVIASATPNDIAEVVEGIVSQSRFAGIRHVKGPNGGY